MAAVSLLSLVLSDDEFNSLNESMQRKLEAVLQKQKNDFEYLNIKFAKIQTQSEQQCLEFDLQLQQLCNQTQEKESLFQEINDGKGKFEADLVSSQDKLKHVESILTLFEATYQDFKKEKESLLEEINNLHSQQLSRRNDYLDRLAGELKALTDELVLKSEAAIKTEELYSLQLSLEYQDRRFNQDHDLGITSNLQESPNKLKKVLKEATSHQSEEVSSQITTLEAKSASMTEEVELAEDSEVKLCEKASDQVKNVEIAQVKYDRESIQHAAYLEQLNAVHEQFEQIHSQLVILQQMSARIESELSSDRVSWIAEKEEMDKEITEKVRRCFDLETNVDLMLKKMILSSKRSVAETRCHQVAERSQSDDVPKTSFNVSISEVVRSTDQPLELVPLLFVAKETSIPQAELKVQESESQRLKSELEQAERLELEAQINLRHDREGFARSSGPSEIHRATPTDSIRSTAVACHSLQPTSISRMSQPSIAITALTPDVPSTSLTEKNKPVAGSSFISEGDHTRSTTIVDGRSNKRTPVTEGFLSVDDSSAKRTRLSDFQDVPAEKHSARFGHMNLDDQPQSDYEAKELPSLSQLSTQLDRASHLCLATPKSKQLPKLKQDCQSASFNIQSRVRQSRDDTKLRTKSRGRPVRNESSNLDRRIAELLAPLKPLCKGRRRKTSLPVDDRINGLILATILQMLPVVDLHNVPQDKEELMKGGLEVKDIGAIQTAINVALQNVNHLSTEPRQNFRFPPNLASFNGLRGLLMEEADDFLGSIEERAVSVDDKELLRMMVKVFGGWARPFLPSNKGTPNRSPKLFCARINAESLKTSGENAEGRPEVIDSLDEEMVELEPSIQSEGAENEENRLVVDNGFDVPLNHSSRTRTPVKVFDSKVGSERGWNELEKKILISILEKEGFNGDYEELAQHKDLVNKSSEALRYFMDRCKDIREPVDWEIGLNSNIDDLRDMDCSQLSENIPLALELRALFKSNPDSSQADGIDYSAIYAHLAGLMRGEVPPLLNPSTRNKFSLIFQLFKKELLAESSGSLSVFVTEPKSVFEIKRKPNGRRDKEWSTPELQVKDVLISGTMEDIEKFYLSHRSLNPF